MFLTPLTKNRVYMLTKGQNAAKCFPKYPCTCGQALLLLPTHLCHSPSVLLEFISYNKFGQFRRFWIIDYKNCSSLKSGWPAFELNRKTNWLAWFSAADEAQGRRGKNEKHPEKIHRIKRRQRWGGAPLKAVPDTDISFHLDHVRGRKVNQTFCWRIEYF